MDIRPGQFQVIELYAMIAVGAGSALFVLLLVIARWPDWWELTVPELSPMTRMESLLLFTTAAAGFLSAMFCYLKADIFP
ncbi:MAG: hypothetical protein K6T65_11660 [Peptococcaceae bacterium]|nr:hypothetical protein [Peptococcaceae bacterium]